MQRPFKILALAVLLAVLSATVAAASTPRTVAGKWRTLAPSPIALPTPAHVWTGNKLIVFGRRPLTKTTFNPSVNTALAYDPAANSWQTLAPPTQPGAGPSCCSTIWTGKQMLVFGADLAYTPSTDTWTSIH